MHGYAIRTFDSPASLKSFAAGYIVGRVEQAHTRRVPFSLVLSGGSTPKEVYGMVGRISRERSISWGNIHLFWSDERCVPPDAPESNFGMTRDALLSRITISDTNVHRIRGELPAQQGAFEYEKDLLRFAGHLNSLCFDLVLLGLGDDGHTASLFPASRSLSETEHLVTTATKDGMTRITMTLMALNSSREVFFLVTGKNKAHAVRETLMEGRPVEELPARGICPPEGKVLWLLDEEAASLLHR